MDNCDLSKLTVKPGKLAPKFSPTVLEYSVTLASDIEEVKFAPLTSDSGASYIIKVGWSGCSRGRVNLHLL